MRLRIARMIGVMGIAQQRCLPPSKRCALNCRLTTGRGLTPLLGKAGVMLWFALAISGCQNKIQSYTPSPEITEEAVRRTLDAWKAGTPPGRLPGNPDVNVADAGRKPGQTLEDYRILGETRGSAGRTIAVNLRLANPTEEIKARYIVVGIEPLWVFRQEDYELLMHWDHRMDVEQPVASDAKAESPGQETKSIEAAPETPADALNPP